MKPKIPKTPLDKELESWIATVRTSYLRVENRLRKKEGLEPASRVPVIIKSDPRLLNLKVWTMRYQVDLDFIFSVLLRYYKNVRRHHYMPRRMGVRPDLGCLTLGLSINVLCGVKSRQVIEEAVVRTYPNGENYKAKAQRDRFSLRQIRPLANLDFNSIDEMVSQYGEVMRKRQIEIGTERHMPRPWRGRNL